MNGFLFTEDGKLVCELTKISFEPYKDKRIIKVRCTVCGRIKRIPKWKFDFAEGSSKYKWLKRNCYGDYATEHVIVK